MMEQSKAGTLNKLDWMKLGNDALKWTAPVFALFFAQLASGIEFKVAMWTAVYGIYQLLSNFFKLLSEGK